MGWPNLQLRRRNELLSDLFYKFILKRLQICSRKFVYHIGNCFDKLYRKTRHNGASILLNILWLFFTETTRQEIIDENHCTEG